VIELIHQSRGNGSITFRFFRCPVVFAIAIISFSCCRFPIITKKTQLNSRLTAIAQWFSEIYVSIILLTLWFLLHLSRPSKTTQCLRKLSRSIKNSPQTFSQLLLDSVSLCYSVPATSAAKHRQCSKTARKICVSTNVSNNYNPLKNLTNEPRTRWMSAYSRLIVSAVWPAAKLVVHFETLWDLELF